MFVLIKKYFDSKIYSKNNVAAFVKAGKISESDYKSITGDEFAL